MGGEPYHRLPAGYGRLGGRGSQPGLDIRRFGLDIAVELVGEESGNRPDDIEVHEIEWREDCGNARNQLAEKLSADRVDQSPERVDMLGKLLEDIAVQRFRRRHAIPSLLGIARYFVIGRRHHSKHT